MNTYIFLIIIKYHRKLTTFVHTIPITLHECMQSLIYFYICMLIAFLLLDGWLCFNGNDDILLEKEDCEVQAMCEVILFSWNFLNQQKVHLKITYFCMKIRVSELTTPTHPPERTFLLVCFCFAMHGNHI